jgi:hypothetical protein
LLQPSQLPLCLLEVAGQEQGRIDHGFQTATAQFNSDAAIPQASGIQAKPARNTKGWPAPSRARPNAAPFEASAS